MIELHGLHYWDIFIMIMAACGLIRISTDHSSKKDSWCQLVLFVLYGGILTSLLTHYIFR